MNHDDPSHLESLKLRPRCAICQRSFHVGERVYLLLGDVDSSTYRHCHGPFAFPSGGFFPPPRSMINIAHLYGYRAGENSIDGCVECTIWYDTPVVHPDCYQIVLRRVQSSDLLDYLWTMSNWQEAWSGAVRLQLHSLIVTPDLSKFDEIGLSGMSRLPPEILPLVQDYSASSDFWRYQAALNFGRDVSAIPQRQSRSVPLDDILEWNRGEVPRTAGTGVDRSPLLRLTLDVKGISRVEGLAECPSFASWRTDSQAFVILRRSSVEDIIARFEFGLMRLPLETTTRLLTSEFRTWDTPGPPKLTDCVFNKSDISEASLFRTIDLSQISGITFFFMCGGIIAVHAHTSAAPHALTTYERLSLNIPEHAVWAYFPIAPTDTIEEFGAQVEPDEDGTREYLTECLLFRTKLCGSVTVGGRSVQRKKDILLGECPSSMIICTISDRRPSYMVGAYPKNHNDTTWTIPFDHHLGDTTLTPNETFSIAPLEDVTDIHIFRETKRDGFGVGLLLEYKNGAQRALGQCRFGIDRVEHVRNPTHICFLATTYKLYEHPLDNTKYKTVFFESSVEPTHSHDGDGWICCPLEGYLEVRSAWAQTKVHHHSSRVPRESMNWIHKWHYDEIDYETFYDEYDDFDFNNFDFGDNDDNSG